MTPLIYVLLRVSVGVSMFVHGLVRLPKLAAFSLWMFKSFQRSALPPSLVKPFSIALPMLEFAIGMFLIAGLLTKQALVAGCIVMMLLLFGSGMIENWDAIPSQLIHVAFFTTLLYFISANKYAADAFIKRSIHPERIQG